MSKYQFPVTTWQEVVQTPKKMSNGVVICNWKAGIEFKNIKTQKLTKVIEKVVFNLHETFEKPTQAVTVAENGRYSIAEEGYGSFPITINIYFKDSPTLRPVVLVHELEITKPRAEVIVNAVLQSPSKLLVENMLRYSFDVKLKPEKKKKKKDKIIDLRHTDPKEVNTDEQSVKNVKTEKDTDREERKRVKEERKRDKVDKKEAKKLKNSKRESEKPGDIREEKNQDDKLKKSRKSDKRVSETKTGIEPHSKKTKIIMDKTVDQTLPDHQTDQNGYVEEQPLQINHHPTILNNHQPPPSTKPKKSAKHNNYWSQLDEPTKKHKVQEVIGKIKEAEENNEDDKLAKILTILGMVDYELGVKYQAAAGHPLEDVSGSALRGINEPSEDAKAGFNLGMIRGETMYALCKTIGLKFDMHHHLSMNIKT